MREQKLSTAQGRTISVAQKPRGVKRLVTEKEYQRQQELLFALEEVSSVLTIEVDLQEILRDMAEIVAKAIGAKWVNFWELTPDKKSTHITASYGMKQSYIDQSREHPIELGKAWIGRAIKTGKPWGTSDILTDPNLSQDLGPTWEAAIKQQDYRALLCIPTISRKGPVGGMCLYFPEPHEFTDFEMRLVTVAANQAATAIINAQIFNDLIAERNKTISMVNSLADGIVVYDLEGAITEFNPKAEELLWVPRNTLIGKNPAGLPRGKNNELKNLREISTLPLQEFETQEITFQEPQRIHLAVTLLPLKEAGSHKTGSMRILHDVTREKETEQLKSNFVSIASHQLRTPLSGIKWALSLLLEKTMGPLTKKQESLVTKTLSANEHLINLVNDLLDTSRIEEGRFGYEFKKTNLVSVVDSALQDCRTVLAEKANVGLKVEKSKQKLPPLAADAKKLEMAVYNILDNAIKYTPKGNITVSLRKQKSFISLTVQDTGIGIPKDQQHYLFTKFFRAKNAILLQTEGSGLGLWIANEIIKRHKGKIVLIESEENKGTTFMVRLPIAEHLKPNNK